MKLRNKKTGEIVEYDKIGFRKGLSNGWKDFVPNAESIAELNENWEDYKPKEPLIKNPKIREVVKGWAEATNRAKGAKFDYDGVSSYSMGFASIDFGCSHMEKFAAGSYTIEELCGEEEYSSARELEGE